MALTTDSAAKRPQWLVLCSADDVDAVWAAVGLRELTGARVDIIMPEELATRARWRHTVSGSSTSTRMVVAPDLDVTTNGLVGVLNRLTVVREETFAALPAQDRAYAAEEITALLCAWLLSLECRVLNRPSPACLVDWRRPAEWRLLAANAGLRAAPWRGKTAEVADLGPPAAHAALVVGDEVVGRAAAPIADGLRRLSAVSGVELFEATFDADWALIGVEVLPALRSWGLDAVAALEAAATTTTELRATERQRRSGSTRPAWPGNAENAVLLLGVASEPPLRMVADQLARLDVPHLVWDQRSAHVSDAEIVVADGLASGVLWIDGRGWPLDEFGGVYNRVADVASQPELAGVSEEDPRRAHAEAIVDLLLTWCDVTPARVVNPLRAMASNASKPYQLALIAQSFATPDTMVTSEPEEVLAFWAEHGRVVYKSTSGARSIVQELVDHDLDRLAAVTRCPTQFQAYVPGIDVRVHTIANGCVFATVIDSQAIDYRYAHHQGSTATMAATSLDDQLAARCLELSDRLGLAFAGIDLRVTPDGEVYCLEVNPSPAYSAFEIETGQTISLALAAYLADLRGHG